LSKRQQRLLKEKNERMTSKNSTCDQSFKQLGQQMDNTYEKLLRVRKEYYDARLEGDVPMDLRCQRDALEVDYELKIDNMIEFLRFPNENQSENTTNNIEIEEKNHRIPIVCELVTNVEEIAKRPRMVYTKNKRKRDESIKIDATSIRVLYLSNLGPKVHVYEIKQWILSVLKKTKGSDIYFTLY
jgi:hypothetical protein